MPTLPDGASRPRTRTISVTARGETFRLAQHRGILLVCARQHGSCCCGWEEKARMPFATELWSTEWERRRLGSRVHLTFTGCLGPCAVGNSAVLQLGGRTYWLKDLNESTLVSEVFDYIEALLGPRPPTAPPASLAGHIYDRFATTGAGRPD